MILVMCFQEQFDFSLYPTGFRGVRGTDDNQIIRLGKSGLDVVAEIAGEGQLILVAEDPFDLLDSRTFLDCLRNTKMLELPLYFRSHSDIPFRMPV